MEDINETITIPDHHIRQVIKDADGEITAVVIDPPIGYIQRKLNETLETQALALEGMKHKTYERTHTFPVSISVAGVETVKKGDTTTYTESLTEEQEIENAAFQQAADHLREQKITE